MAKALKKTSPAVGATGVAHAAVADSPLPKWLLAGLLFWLTMALYWPVTRCGFVNYDDPLYVTANVPVQAGLTVATIGWAFLNPVASNWHPLTVISHMADCQLYGLKPWGHHLTSLIIHSLNGVLVFLCLLKMTGAKWRSWLVAAVFAGHPLRVESVAWVAERKDVLCGFFGLLTLWFYAGYARRTRRDDPSTRSGNYWLALGCFALGLMCKPMLVTWPFVLLLLDYWPLQRFELARLKSQRLGFQRLLLEKLPFLVLAASAGVVTFLVQRQAGSVATAQNIPFEARCSNALVSYISYLGKIFWPTDLAVLYPYPGYWPTATWLLSGVLLVGLSGLFYRLRHAHPYLLVGWGWFLGTLVPVLGLVQVGDQAMADRYTYLPTLGVLVMIVWGAHAVASGWRYQWPLSVVSGLVILAACGLATRSQLGYWQDSEALFRHTLQVTQNNSVAHNNLGDYLCQQGRLEEAMIEFKSVLQLQPDNAKAQFNLGTACLLNRQPANALPHLQAAVRRQPNLVEAHYNLGNAHYQLRQFAEAIGEYEEALRLNPKYANARDNLARAQAKLVAAAP